jgi:hypothetical protein
MKLDSEISFSFVSKVEKDKILITGLKRIAKFLDINLLVLHMDKPKVSPFNTKFVFQHHRDMVFINACFVRLQVGYSVTELLAWYHKTAINIYYR